MPNVGIIPATLSAKSSEMNLAILPKPSSRIQAIVAISIVRTPFFFAFPYLDPFAGKSIETRAFAIVAHRCAYHGSNTISAAFTVSLATVFIRAIDGLPPQQFEHTLFSPPSPAV